MVENIKVVSIKQPTKRLGGPMIPFLSQVAKMDVELTVEERNLLSVAYKNVVGSVRFFVTVWRLR